MRETLFLLALAALTRGEAVDVDRKAEFLRTARVVKAVAAGSGVTDSWRLTLRDEEMTHDAHFQSVDERATRKKVDAGLELDFVDSYRYNVAAYRLARLLGLDDMVPVSVERRWRSRSGAMTWWVDDVVMDENGRIARGRRPPDGERWSRQADRVKLFSELVRDTDRNQSNVLITRSWNVWMIDFTRAFRLRPELRSEDAPLRCDRDVYERLRAMTLDELKSTMGEVLEPPELEGVLARRDLLVEHFEKLMRERGESAVLHGAHLPDAPRDRLSDLAGSKASP